jgi:hypothetical protein
MLFNITSKNQFLNKRTGEEIRCLDSTGPHFGNDELAALKEPFNYDG